MKKILFSVVLVLFSFSVVNAEQNRLGLKFGNGAEISYQRLLSDANRLEFNLGLNSFDNNSSFSLSGIYQWTWDLSQLAPGFQWYAGVGGMIGTRTGGVADNDNQSDFRAWVIGNIGIEYNFEFPLQLALDWTPAIRVTPNFGAFGADHIRFAARWRF